MQLLDHIQQFIMQPSLLIQYFTANLSILIFIPLFLATLAFIGHVAFFVWPKCSDGTILKLNIGEAALSIFGAITQGTKGDWVTPLTSIGGVLGIALLLQTSTLFTDISALFGIILLIAPLVSKVMEKDELSIFTNLGNSIGTILTLWAVFGELLAALIFLAGLNLSNPLLTNMFRVVVCLCIVLAFVYVIKWHHSQQVQKKASSAKRPEALSDSIVFSIETHSPPEFSHLPKP